MRTTGFIFFIFITLWYLWAGKDFFNKKDWLLFFLKFIGVLILTVIFGFMLKFLMSVWSGLSLSTAKELTSKFGASLSVVLGMKFLVVMLCEIFSRIMGFHQKYNQENYNGLSSLANKFSSPLLILAKCVVSCGSMLIFYGIWLA
ncbi:hypothetical protein ABW286_22855 [Erwinia papayae]|uniref:Membrane protein n=2 Tax=Erwinia TaxID=551 RepID=A0A014M6I7_9GAMM|nr:hypothetical protein [Erwinia mallotivora]EXU77411.1 membrane protein [Erwinia mallotivora]